MDDNSFIETCLPCPKCGSSDALAMNADGSTKCFSCDTFDPRDNRETTTTTTEYNKKPMTKKTTNNFLKGEAKAIAPRGLHLETCKKYKYHIGVNDFGKTVHIANYYDKDYNLIGQKHRDAEKNFNVEGRISDYFFGQQLWKTGGADKLLICEGEIDTLTASQLQNNKYPVVGIGSASSAKSLFKKNLQWLDTFNKIYLMFDEDDAGRKAVEEAVKILPPGKAYVARLNAKDPNELLLKGRGDEVVKAFWEAEKWSPCSIIDGSTLFDKLTEVRPNDSIPYPFTNLNTKTRGLRKSEITTFCAGSGIGKSQVCRQIAHHIIKTTESKVGYIALEESVERSAEGILGIELKELLHLNPVTVDEKYKKAFDATLGTQRLLFYDHWGSLDPDRIIADVRYMAQAMDVSYVVLDHISLVVSGLSDSDLGSERKALDVIMTRLRALVEETGIALILVSHLKRPEGNRGHEEGVTVSLSHLRGSASLAQLSDMVIGLERSQQNPEEQHITTLRVLKNRFSGETGIAGHIHYDTNTGILTDADADNPF
jgi:twinkle protein